jgi:hypothetical protein
MPAGVGCATQPSSVGELVQKNAAGDCVFRSNRGMPPHALTLLVLHYSLWEFDTIVLG